MENGSEVRAVEIRYAGVVVGRSTKVRDWDTSGAFIGFAEPLPSGTSLVLKGDGLEQAARVVEVFESADPAVAGMQVKFTGAAEVARPAPKPAPAAVTAEPAPAPHPAPAVGTAEAAPVEASDAPSSAATAEPSDGETGQAEHGGQAGSGGKRRRRRR